MGNRPLVTVGLLAAACMAVPQVASAATIGMQGGELRYDAQPHERNDLTIGPATVDENGSYVPVIERSARLTLGAGCVADILIRCDAAGVVAVLGDRSDRADVGPFTEDASVWAGEGDDVVSADGFRAAAWGGPGNDTVHLSSNSESIGDGGAGHDTLTAGAAAVVELWGRQGNDTMTSSAYVQFLDGGAGSDTIVPGPSGAFNDATVRGGAGADVIKGGHRVFGEDGADRIDVSGSEPDFSGEQPIDDVSCGQGHDTVVADPEDRVGPDCENVSRTT
jgi:Ca2+-binding RTX toxin-like protein